MLCHKQNVFNKCLSLVPGGRCVFLIIFSVLFYLSKCEISTRNRTEQIKLKTTENKNECSTKYTSHNENYWKLWFFAVENAADTAELSPVESRNMRRFKCYFFVPCVILVFTIPNEFWNKQKISVFSLRCATCVPFDAHSFTFEHKL